jgi:hypothetical protein
MSHYHRRILLGYFLTVALGACWAVAQDAPKIKIVPRNPPPEKKPAPANADEKFQPTPTGAAGAPASAVSRLLAEDKTYKSGDLLTWERVKPVLDRLRRAKVPMPPEKEMQAKFLSEKDSLVKMLSTPDGKAFFKELAKKPASIDLVDRYRELPQSEPFLREFTHDVDGYKFFTEPYWLSPSRAQRAESEGLLDVSNGVKLGEPTGRIYLESQLISFLNEYKKSGKTRTYE